MINLSDSTPAAPAGGVNVKWQQDASGNVSAYASLAGGGKQTVAPVAGALAIDASLGNSFLINVTAAITSITISNPTDGQELTLLWVQDSTGHTVTIPANILGVTTPSSTASAVSAFKITYNVGDTNWYGIPCNGV